ncbi:hypothetical protein GQ44DRAFT_667906 [Phaeosphaeriaceae sp. PMI808]|nr:hypothetical protein GQ44DRAFT_667906 [Phaeosphaeriaceae sp. PMI808]
MDSELTVYMLQHRHDALSRALYGDEHGCGERTLKLEMISGQENLDIELPVLCRYENNSPVLVTSKIDKSEWVSLYNTVEARGRVKVILYDGTSDYLAKLTILGAKPPSDGGNKMKFYWKESDDNMEFLEKGIGWITKRLKRE